MNKITIPIALLTLLTMALGCSKWNLEPKTIGTTTTPTPSVAVYTAIALSATGTPASIIIDNSTTNGNPDALLFVCVNSRNGQPFVNTLATGVTYDGSKWRVGFTNSSPLPSGYNCNILIVDPKGSNAAFKHKVSPTNRFPSASSSYQDGLAFTTLSDSRLDGNPNARLLVSQRFSAGSYNNSPVGVRYRDGKWQIFNVRKNVDFTDGVEFNILIDAALKIEERTDQNGFDNQGVFTTLGQGNLEAKLFATIYSTGSIFTTIEVGVLYASPRWSIYNLREKQNTPYVMPDGCKFFVLVQ